MMVSGTRIFYSEFFSPSDFLILEKHTNESEGCQNILDKTFKTTAEPTVPSDNWVKYQL